MKFIRFLPPIRTIRSVVAVLLLCAVVSKSAGFDFEQIAVTGDLAPGTDGDRYRDVFGAKIINHGDMVFGARLDSLPGDFFYPEVVIGPTAGSGSEPGILTPEFGRAPGIDGVEITSLSGLAINGTGEAAWIARLRADPGTPQVNFSNDTALYRTSAKMPSTLELIIREGAAAPGRDDATVISIRNTHLDPQGNLIFVSSLRLNDPSPTGEIRYLSGLYRSPAGSSSNLELLAQAGRDILIPELGGGEIFQGIDSARMNRVGDVIFDSSVSINDSNTGERIEGRAILSTRYDEAAPFEVLLGPNESVPGLDGANYSSFVRYAFNDLGDFVINAATTPAHADTQWGQFSPYALVAPLDGPNSAMGVVARGQDFFSTAYGENYFLNYFGDVLINNRGDVVFEAFLNYFEGEYDENQYYDDDDAVNHLFAYIDGRLHLIAREGDALAVERAEGVVEIEDIRDIDFTDRALSDDGLLALSFRFWDGSSGVFTVSVDDLALAGDYNADGFVTQADLDLVLLNWGDSVVPPEWLATDQFDGVQVSQNELDSVLLNWGDGTQPSLAIPEPASLTILAAALAFTRRRPRIS